MIEDRIQELEAATSRGRPLLHDATFPAAEHTNPEIQSFLRGQDRTMMFKCGGGIANARCHAAVLNKETQRYTVHANPDGIGDRACVKITQQEFQEAKWMLQAHRIVGIDDDVVLIQQALTDIPNWPSSSHGEGS